MFSYGRCELNCLDDVNSASVHRAIYAARPDVGAIIHGHTPYARAFSMQDQPLKMIVQGGSSP